MIHMFVERGFVTVSRARKPTKREKQADPALTEVEEVVVINFDKKDENGEPTAKSIGTTYRRVQTSPK